MSSSTAASGDFPIYPSERPSVADAKVWRLGSFDVMPSDWKALTAGIPPHSLVHLIDCIVPPPLPEDAVGPPSIIVAMSLTRGMAIMDANQKNAVILATRNSGMDGIRNSFFDALRRSLRPNEPLLLAALKVHTCPSSVCSKTLANLAGFRACWWTDLSDFFCLNAISGFC